MQISSIFSYLLWRLRLSLGGCVWLFSCKLARDELRVITSLNIPSTSNRSLCSTSSPQSRIFGDGEFRNTSLDEAPEVDSWWCGFCVFPLDWNLLSLRFLFWCVSPGSQGLLSLCLLKYKQNNSQQLMVIKRQWIVSISTYSQLQSI